MDPKNGSALIDFVSSVKSVETNGNNQVIVRLKEPNAMWKYIPALPVGMVVSQKNIEQLQSGGGTIGSPSALPLGTGAYSYASWDRGQSVKMERYDGYWDEEKALQVKNQQYVLSQYMYIDFLVAGLRIRRGCRCRSPCDGVRPVLQSDGPLRWPP